MVFCEVAFRTVGSLMLFSSWNANSCKAKWEGERGGGACRREREEEENGRGGKEKLICTLSRSRLFYRLRSYLVYQCCQQLRMIDAKAPK